MDISSSCFCNHCTPPSTRYNFHGSMPSRTSLSYLSSGYLYSASRVPESNFFSSPKTLHPYLRVHRPNALASPASQAPASARRGADSDILGLMLKERIVFLGSEIDDFVADAIMSQLLLLDAQDHTKSIRLLINSPGGSLSATLAIYDTVQLVRAEVSTIALGLSASTASIVLGGGSKGRRLAMPNTRIMIHQPVGGASGQAIDVEIQAREILHSKNNVTGIISSFTGRTVEQVERDIDRDKYMSAIEAVEYGIIDAVIDRDTLIPIVPVTGLAQRGLTFNMIRDNPRKFLTPEIPDDEIY